MKASQLLITLTLWALLVLVNQRFTEDSWRRYLGGLPWYGWASIGGFLAVAAVCLALRDSRRALRMLEDPIEKHVDPNKQTLCKDLGDKYDPNGPDYPHPVIITHRCIECQKCVDACPHDVFTIVDNKPTVTAIEQCMDDTSCQVVCPVTPKACIVVNTTKKIRALPFPETDQTFMSTVPGCYIIGDVSGRPLIKNAANEGAKVIEHIFEKLKKEPPEPNAEFDVAIIGIGPAGLSAAIRAKKLNLRYVGIEKDKVLSTIDAFPTKKDIFFKPETLEANCDVPIMTDCDKREGILDSWRGAMTSNEVVINVAENCEEVKKAEDGNYFTVRTQERETLETRTYHTRRVVVALGLRGIPRKLGKEGKPLDGETKDRVKYELRNPDQFNQRRMLVVGGGNSAVEAAVALVANSEGAELRFRPADEICEVTLAVRSGFTNDLKFANKRKLYKCIDAEKIKLCWDTGVKEIRDGEVILTDPQTEEVKATLGNDYILALVGGDFPTQFFKSIGITIPKA
jgi:thioredoxin reductase (NADPH)